MASSTSKSTLTDGLKGLVDDLTHLEINTIIKANMVATTMPRNMRKALWDLAAGYDKALGDYKDKYKTFLDKVNPETLAQYNEYTASPWKFAGRWSFSVIRKRASALSDMMREVLENGSYDQPEVLEQDMAVVNRKVIFSHELINIFESMAAKKGVVPSKPSSVDAATGDLSSVAWNNDVHLQQISGISQKLPVAASDRLVVKKAFDIGSESIVMQTTIAIDGDVTNRIMRSFALNPNQAVIEIHNSGVKDSVGFWKSLVSIVSSWFTKRSAADSED